MVAEPFAAVNARSRLGEPRVSVVTSVACLPALWSPGARPGAVVRRLRSRRASPEFSTSVEKYVEKRAPDGLRRAGRPEIARFAPGESRRSLAEVGLPAAGAAGELPVLGSCGGRKLPGVEESRAPADWTAGHHGRQEHLGTGPRAASRRRSTSTRSTRGSRRTSLERDEGQTDRRPGR